MAEKSKKPTRTRIDIKEFATGVGMPPGIDGQEVYKAMEPYFVLVGKIASNWGLLELSMDQTIWKLAKVAPAKGACITAQYGSTYLRIKALAALMRETIPNADPLISKLNSLSSNIETAVRKRNRAVHDPLMYRAKDKAVLDHRVTAERRLDFGAAKVNKREYMNTLNSIISIQKEFEALRKEILQAAASDDRRQ